MHDAIIRTARAMNDRGLNQGTSGNVSGRLDGGMLITPSAVPYDRLDPEMLVAMSLDGAAASGGKPSTEWRLHAGVYRARPDVRAIVHAHAPYCTTLACLHRPIPAFHYMVAVAGGTDIRCAPYATVGTPALAAHALEALEGRQACLLANHGMLAVGESPDAALAMAVEVEALAGVYWRALQVGDPVILSDAEMADILERFEDYRRGAAPDELS
jgi:L-fuculose-phosphate aldolase